MREKRQKRTKNNAQVGTTMKDRRPKRARPKRRIEDRSITSLKPHPSQVGIFDDVNDVKLRLPVDDLDENGSTATP
jgi:hypothetical protein